MAEETQKPTDAIVALLQNVTLDVRQQAIALVQSNAKLEEVAREVAAINKVVRGDNGRDSMSVRLALVERAMGEAAGSLHEMRKAMEARLTEDQKGKWQLVTTVITSIVAIICAIIAAIVTYMKN